MFKLGSSLLLPGASNPIKKLTRFFYGIPGAGNGNHNRIDFSSAITLSGAFTIGFWGFLIDQSTASYSNVSICGNQTAFLSGRLCFNTNYFRIDTPSASDQHIDFSAVNLEDTFKYIEFKRAAGTNVITMYVNKVAVGTVTAAGTLTINRVMGGPADSGWLGFGGGMREFKIYTSELSEAESDTNYTGGHVSANCQLWYKLNDLGTSIVDYSGNGRTGTLAGAVASIYDAYKGATFNLLQNSGFAAWTGTPDAAVPNNFTRAGVYAAGVRYLLDSGGKMQLVSTDGALCGISKTIFTVGKKYRARCYVHSRVSGGVYIYDGANGANAQNSINTPGMLKFDFNALGSSIGLFRRDSGFANDITISHFSLSEI